MHKAAWAILAFSAFVIGAAMTAVVLPAVLIGSSYAVKGTGAGISLVLSSSGTSVVLNDLVSNSGFAFVQEGEGIKLFEASSSILSSGVSVLSTTPSVAYLTPFTTVIRLTDMPTLGDSKLKRFEAALTISFNLTDNQTDFAASLELPDIFPHTLFRSVAPMGTISCIWGTGNGGSTPYKSAIYSQLYTGGTNTPFIFINFHTDYAPNSPGFCSIKYNDILPYES